MQEAVDLMPGFEPRSFIIVAAVLGALCAFIFFVLRRSFPSDIKGIGQWAWACLVLVVAALLFASAPALPGLLGSYVPNLLVLAGIMLMHGSVLRFDMRPDARRVYGVLLALAAMALVWPTFVDDNYRARVVIVSLVIFGVFAWSAYAVAQVMPRHFPERFTQVLFAVSAAIAALRCTVALASPAAIDATADVSLLQHVYLASFALSTVALSLGFLLMVNRRLQLRLEHAASHDNLTHTLRRDAFFHAFAVEVSRAIRHQTTLSLLMIDLDEFKLINDRLGHLAGDRVLTDFAGKMRQVLRQHDLIGRYGGEEFLVLLPETDEHGALSVAERVRQLAQHQASPAVPNYTVSIGVATAKGTQTRSEALLQAADAALYSAKNKGRNCVEAVH